MRKKCFIHVGIHKTATTTIQRFLTSNAEHLARLALYVPRTGRIDPLSGNHNLAWELNNDPRFNKAYGSFDDLKKELQDVRTHDVVLSSEDFEHIYYQDSKKKFLFDFFTSLGFDIQIVVFLRNQVDYANSLFSTLLLFGLNSSFEQYLAEIISKNCYYETNYKTQDGSTCKWRFCFDYHKFLTSWSEQFGDNIICRSFDAERGLGRIEDRFLACLGINPSKQQKQVMSYYPAVNKSMGQSAIEVISLYNIFIKNLQIDPEKKLKGISYLFKKYQDTEINDKPFNGFSSSEREEVSRVFSDKNALVSKRYGVEVLILPGNEKDGETNDNSPKLRISQAAIYEVANIVNNIL